MFGFIQIWILRSDLNLLQQRSADDAILEMFTRMESRFSQSKMLLLHLKLKISSSLPLMTLSLLVTWPISCSLSYAIINQTFFDIFIYRLKKTLAMFFKINRIWLQFWCENILKVATFSWWVEIVWIVKSWTSLCKFCRFLCNLTILFFVWLILYYLWALLFYLTSTKKKAATVWKSIFGAIELRIDLWTVEFPKKIQTKLSGNYLHCTNIWVFILWPTVFGLSCRQFVCFVPSRSMLSANFFCVLCVSILCALFWARLMNRRQWPIKVFFVFSILFSEMSMNIVNVALNSPLFHELWQH